MPIDARLQPIKLYIAASASSWNFSVAEGCAGADPGGGHGGPMPPPSGLSPRKTRRFATRLAHVATLTQCTSLYESLLHVLHT